MRFRFRLYLISSLLFLSAFAAPSSAHALGNDVLQNCASVTGCDSNLTCVQKNNVSGFNIQPLDNICMPEPAYANCGLKNEGLQIKGKCELGSFECAVISSLKRTNAYVDSCVSKSKLPQMGVLDQTDCSDSTDCNVGEQCVLVSLPNDTGTNTTFGTHRCISILDLPTKIVDDAGSCFAKKKCDPGLVCVRHIDDKTVDNPFVCQKNTDVKPAPTCIDKTTIGTDCVIDGTPGTCLDIFIGTSKPVVQCVRKDTLIGGVNAPSSQVCTNDNDCSSVTGFPYCVTNPATGKNQCFGQDQIYTAMTNPADAKCTTGSPSASCACTANKITGCAGNAGGSVCSTHLGGSGGFICIHNQALSAGTTTVGYTPAATPQDSNTRPAPVLEVAIPTVNFSDALTGTSTTGGQIFNVDYLATYINGAYKYGIGVGVLFATLLLMYAGFSYMTAFGNAKQVSTATDNARNAIMGLALLFSAYTILYIIDPNITQLKSIQIFSPSTEVFDIGTANFVDENSTPQSTPPSVSSSPSAFDDIFKKYAQCSGINWELMKAIAKHESGLNPNIPNGSGSSCIGLFQAKAGKDNAFCKAVLKPVHLDVKCDVPGLTDPDLNTAFATEIFKVSVPAINKRCPDATFGDKVFLLYFANGNGPSGMNTAITAYHCNPVSNPSTWPDPDTRWPAGTAHGLGGVKVYHGATKAYNYDIVNVISALGVTQFSGPMNASVCPTHH